MMLSILRMPAMCDQFQKALKRKRTADQIRELQQESINHLRNHVSEANQTEFFDTTVQRLEEDPFTEIKVNTDESTSEED